MDTLKNEICVRFAYYVDIPAGGNYSLRMFIQSNGETNMQWTNMSNLGDPAWNIVAKTVTITSPRFQVNNH